MLEDVNFNESIQPTAIAINQTSMKEEVSELKGYYDRTTESKPLSHEQVLMVMGTSEG